MDDFQSNASNLKPLTDALAKSHPNLNCAPDTPLDSEIDDPNYSVKQHSVSAYEASVASEKTIMSKAINNQTK